MKRFLLTPVLICIAGCGDGRPDRVPVSGQVLVDGKPLTYGSIQFIPKGARASQGQLDKEGRFTLTCFTEADGAVVGDHTIVIMAGEPIGSTKTKWHAPKKFSDYRTSGFTQAITGPEENLIVNISWEGGRPFVEEEDSGETAGFRPGARGVPK